MSGIVKKNWPIKLWIALTLCALLYLFAHPKSSSTWTTKSSKYQFNSVVPIRSPPAYNTNDEYKDDLNLTKSTTEMKNLIPMEVHDPEEQAENSLLESQTAFKSNVTDKKDLELPSKQLRYPIICNEMTTELKISQRQNFWVLNNYVPMSFHVKCWESLTYATHADFTYLDNLMPLLERWKAPVSVALYAPGADFDMTVNSIKYARNCLSPLIRQFVTFHIYFDSKHMPKSIPKSSDVISANYDCSQGEPWANIAVKETYRSKEILPYPVNVGRNIARENSPTHYILLSDIELYPSLNLPEAFLDMIRRRDQEVVLKPNPKVFVLPIFEVNEEIPAPKNKTVLISMLKNGSAITFHKKICPSCHNQPRSQEWRETPESGTLRVFQAQKRTGKFAHWEPIFIGTNAEPLYDERLTWEGRNEKMLQGYAMCVLDYDFLILNNAFLVHRPGIKIFTPDKYRDSKTATMNVLINKIYLPETKMLYGTREGCGL